MFGKRILIVAGVTVAAYVATSWALGRAAHARFDTVEQQLAQQPVSLLKIAERSYTPGVFSSVEVVTFELDRELWEAMTRPSTAGPDEFPVDDEAFEGEGGDFEQAMASEEQLDAEEGSSPLRLTVRNEMSHGPLPGFTSFGVAKIRSTLVLDEALQAKVAEVLGDREPLVIDTLVGFTGAGRVHASSPPFEIKAENQHFAWQGIEGRFTYSRNANSFTCAVLAPGAEGEFADARFHVGKMELQCDMHRAFGQLFAGTSSLSIESLRGSTSSSDAPIAVEAMRYTGDIRVDGEYVDMAMNFGIGNLKVAHLDMSDIRYDLALNHLHGPTYAAAMEKIQAMSAPGAANAPQDPATAMSAVMEPLLAVLEHSPQLVIERIGFKVPEGEIGVTGTVQLQDFAKADFQNASSQLELIRKVEATADIWIDEGVLTRNWSGESVQEAQTGASPVPDRVAAIRHQVAQLERQGYLQRKGDRLQSRVEFKQGMLIANGKPLGSP